MDRRLQKSVRGLKPAQVVVDVRALALLTHVRRSVFNQPGVGNQIDDTRQNVGGEATRHACVYLGQNAGKREQDVVPYHGERVLAARAVAVASLGMMKVEGRPVIDEPEA